jgi:hypothetical protein
MLASRLLIDLGKMQGTSLGSETMKLVQKYEYIIITRSFLDHRRHTASPLQRPTNECSSAKCAMFDVRNTEYSNAVIFVTPSIRLHTFLLHPVSGCIHYTSGFYCNL